MSKTTNRAYLRTALAILFLVIMLFPLYWMVNASFQASGNTLNATLIPTDPSLAGYEVALRDQGRNLVTSLIIATGTVILTLVTWDLIDTLPLPLAVAGHEGSTVVVALNGARLLRRSAWGR